jgi:hypothetical protein
MDEIGLPDLIDQVKRELLAPNPAARARDPYPLLAIEAIELEIAIKVTRSTDGSVKLSVLDAAEVNVGRSTTREHAHIVRVKLTPLRTKEEMLAELNLSPSQQHEQAINSVRLTLRGPANQSTGDDES